MRAWCIWCENGESKGKHGYYWIHMKCAEQLIDINGDIESIKKMLLGIHRRNQDDEDKFNVIMKYIEDMEDFRRRWDNTMKLIKGKNSSKETVGVV
jgi:hypothetical protein